MNSISHKKLFAVIIVWVVAIIIALVNFSGQAHGGGKPNAPSNARIESVGPTSNSRVIGPRFDAVAPKLPTLTPEQMMQRGGVNRIIDEVSHQANKPTKPDTGPVFREFNVLTDQHEKYRDDLSDWQAQGRELRQKYNDPQGFGTR